MQIDRVMESFAKHYCLQNPNLFDETDTCYILSFSIIMLNTALHNINIKKKITCEQFVAQNRGINSGKDLPRDILVRYFFKHPPPMPGQIFFVLIYELGFVGNIYSSSFQSTVPPLHCRIVERLCQMKLVPIRKLFEVTAALREV
jgi:hypothetical protein